MGKQSFSWGSIPDSNKSSGGGAKSQDLYMKLKPDTRHKIRLYGEPAVRYFAWHEKTKYTVPEDLIEDFERHTGEKPRLYIIANVIDRDDTKDGKTRFKLLEKGSSVFSVMKTYAEETGVDPGGENGPDFVIKVIAGKEARNTKYEVMNMPKESPFSTKEKELISRKDRMDPEELKKLPIGERGPIDLESFYDLDKARKRIMELLDGNVSNPDNLEDIEDSLSIDEDEPVAPVKKPKKAPVEEEESLDDLIDQFE